MYLGIDIGTVSIKAGLFTQDGELVRGVVNRYRSLKCADSFLEIDPNLFWLSLCKVMRELRPLDVQGVSVGGHGPSPVFLDASMKPVAPSLLWLDRRAAREARELSESIGRDVHPAWYIPQTMWIRNHRPDLFMRIKKVLQPMDYISWRLTGSLYSSVASREILPWSSEEVEAAGLNPELFPEHRVMGELIGYVTQDASRQTGLRGGVPVYAGAPDFVEAILATAAFEKGLICDKAGTSEGIELCWSSPIRGFYTAPHPVARDMWHTGATLSTTGLSLEWLASITSKDAGELALEAELAPPGSRGLIFLPYLAYERHGVSAKGAFLNLTLEHATSELARAVMEGCACAMRLVIENFKENGAEPREIRTTGTQSLSRLWNQIKADVTSLPVVSQMVPEGEMLGAAMVAAYGSGEYRSISEASREMAHARERFHPNEDIGEEIFDRFKRAVTSYLTKKK